MTKTVQGVVRGNTIVLAEPLGLQEGEAVEVRVSPVAPQAATPDGGLASVYAILGERYESGHGDTAARHDEHQNGYGASSAAGS